MNDLEKIWDYLIDLQKNTPNSSDGSIKIVQSNDNYFYVSLIDNSIFIFFKIEINYSFTNNCEFVISKTRGSDINGEGYNKTLNVSEIVSTALKIIRNNKLSRIGV